MGGNRGWEKGRASLLGLFAKRWVLISPPQSLPEKSLPSLLLLFVSRHKGGADGVCARQGACPPWGGSVLQAAAVPTTVSLSRLPLPKAEGFCCQVGLRPLGLCQHGLSHCFPFFPVSNQGLPVAHRAGWPGSDFGICVSPIRTLYETVVAADEELCDRNTVR